MDLFGTYFGELATTKFEGIPQVFKGKDDPLGPQNLGSYFGGFWRATSAPGQHCVCVCVVCVWVCVCACACARGPVGWLSLT